MKRYSRKFPFVYCRDIEKEGLTKPRALLKVMLQAIEEKYECGIKPDFFEDFRVYDDGNITVPPRGHG